MKQTFLLFLSLIFCAILQAETITATSYAGGTGSRTDPYRIATLAQLRLLSETSTDWVSSFILTADIDASDTKTWNTGHGFSCIGTSASAFTGVFDGNGHTIDSLYIHTVNDYSGMFGFVSDGARIKNLGLTNCAMSLSDIGGGLAGRITMAQIEKCYVTGTVTAPNVNRLGGIVGVMTNSSIIYCYTNCIVKTEKSSTNVGGIVGLINGISSIENCFVADTCKIPPGFGGNYGGIAGQMESSDITIANCYISGAIDNTENVITGVKMGRIKNCYYDKTINPGSCSNATGLTSSDFSNAAAFSGWDFESTWKVLALANVDSIMRPNLQWSYDHLVTFESDKNKGTIIGANIQGIAHNSSALKVTVSPSTGYYFDEWQNADGDSISADNPLTIENVTQDSTLKAVFTPYNYTVTFSADENSTLAGNTTQTVAYGSDATEVTATSVTAGYGFVEWQDASGNSISTHNPLILNVTKDLSLKAVFAKKYEDGIGSDDSPYQIATLEQLKSLSETTGDWTRSFILTTDIDATDTKNWNISGIDTLGFSPIGDWDRGDRQKVTFTGSFDGNNHIISNLYIKRAERFLGLFGCVEKDVVIKNTGLTNISITSNTNETAYAGAIVGYADGRYGEMKISNCFAAGGSIIAANKYVGGLIGDMNRTDLTNCFSNVNVEGNEVVGGLIGYAGYTPSSNIKNCYAAGKVSGNSNVGGFIGDNTSATAITITNCYYDSISTEQAKGTGSVQNNNLTALTTAQFADTSIFSDWDFESTWKVLALASIDSVIRPNLQWSYDHVVTFELGENGDSIAGAYVQGVADGSDALEVLALANEGYEFVEWQDSKGNEVSTDNPFTLTKVTQDSTITAVFAKGTGIETVPAISNLNIYPNPTTGLVNISLASEEGSVQLSIYSITGEMVYSNPAFNGGSVDLSGLNKGVYVVNVKVVDKISMLKLIVK